MSMRAQQGERGVALLLVLITLTLASAVVMEFAYASRIDLQLAYNARDELQAEYNALAVLRLRALMLKQSRQLEGPVNSMIAAITGDASAKLPMGQILEMVPVECGLLSAVFKRAGGGFGSTDEAAASEASDDGFFPGECSATSESEHSKISVNMLARGTNRVGQQIGQILFGFLSDRRLERFFQEDDASGSHAESPAALVAALTDWIDRDHNETGNNVADEDRYYDRGHDDYRAKNAPFDSLAELQLVHGMGDRLYDLLAPHLTIYSDSTAIELATAGPDRILLGLLAARREGVTSEQLELGMQALLKLLGEVQQLAAVPGLGVLTVTSLTAMVQQSGLDGLIDVNLLKQVFTDRSGATWYTLRAQGRVGNVTKQLTAVFQSSEGEFYYYRVD